MMRAGVLAVQGDFAEHEKMLARIGATYAEIRKKEDLLRSYDALIFPGGESTVMEKLIGDLGMKEELVELIEGGIPVLATCAGLILLSEKVTEGIGSGNRREDERPGLLSTLPVTASRNAYGRQLASFHTEDEMAGIGNVPMTFIRAPYITDVSDETDILARTGGAIVAVRFKNQLAMSFHPELDDDPRIYEHFAKGL